MNHLDLDTLRLEKGAHKNCGKGIGPVCLLEGCSRPSQYQTQSLCAMHATRLRRTGEVGPIEAYRGPSLSEAFWSRVERRGPDQCWPWIGWVSSNGYGRYNHHATDRSYSAPRLALLLDGRPVPDGLDTCHSCDNRLCVNPAHLRAGTRSENMIECVERGRFNRPKGEQHPRAKLTSAQVKEIRSRRAAGEFTTSLGREFGVNPATITRIVQGVLWREVA